MKNLILTFLLVLTSTLAFSQDETFLRYIDGDWVTEVNPNSHDELQVRTTGPYKAYNRLSGEYFVWSPVDSIWQCAYCDQTVQAQGVDGLFIKHPNGIIEYTGETVGDVGVLDGITYTSVDNATLSALDPASDDYTVVVTSLVTDMAILFRFDSTFNQDIGSWDVSNTTSMNQTFSGATAFNQDISSWDVSNVSNMRSMFLDATTFNQDIGNWDVSSVTDMNAMFNNASSFNQDIGNWDVSNVIFMNGTFRDAITFNQDISSWDVSNVIAMAGMFQSATDFNQDLSTWCVPLLSSEPSNFDTSATSWTEPKPVWGTCP